jgi:hypothetical protein
MNYNDLNDVIIMSSFLKTDPDIQRKDIMHQVNHLEMRKNYISRIQLFEDSTFLNFKQSFPWVI